MLHTLKELGVKLCVCVSSQVLMVSYMNSLFFFNHSTISRFYATALMSFLSLLITAGMIFISLDLNFDASFHHLG